ncbi:hypothetical protein EGW08_016121 [Elysia chlorotica]|uniref:Uncharacterized protein n=1 Tax=Elysia chlorotica TaxID=188477 RepID=A0A3S1HBS3_ELYCH|nr:hypothetical protein EGW08_016121 [Elysia chlorotica]
MTSRKGRWRPIQDAVWLLVAITTVSMVITLHLQDGLGWLGSGAQIKVKILKSDLPDSNDGTQDLRVFDKLDLSDSTVNETLTTRVRQDRLRRIRNNTPEPNDPVHSINSKSNFSSQDKTLRRQWNQDTNKKPVLSSSGQSKVNDPDNSSTPVTHLTRLSDKRLAGDRDGYRYVEGAKLKGSDWNVQNVQITALGRDKPETITGQFPLGLPTRKEAKEGNIWFRGWEECRAICAVR